MELADEENEDRKGIVFSFLNFFSSTARDGVKKKIAINFIIELQHKGNYYQG